MPESRPHPSHDQILPFLGYYRKVLHAPSSASAIDRMPARGTTLKAALASGIGLSSAGCTPTELAYLFSHAERAGNDLLEFYFVRSFTDAERNTKVLTEGGNAYYTWPDIMKDLRIEFDRDFPLASTFARGEMRGQALMPRPIVDRLMVRGGYFRSVTRTNHYLSDTPFPVGRFRVAPQPIPDEVFLPYVGYRDGIVALHGDLVIPAQPPAYTAYTATGQSGIGGTQMDGKHLPATNYTEWPEFVLDRQHQFVGGLWHLMEVVLEPPEEPAPHWISTLVL